MKHTYRIWGAHYVCTVRAINETSAMQAARDKGHRQCVYRWYAVRC